jgi:predicted ester cyclase
MRYTSTGTHLGSQFFNIPPTGNKITISEISIFKLKDGKVVEQWNSLDLAGWLMQLGIDVYQNIKTEK